MAELDLTNIAAASIATPAAGVTALFVDTADGRVKTKDSGGAVHVQSDAGPVDRSIVMNGGFSVQQRVAVAATAIPNVSTTTRAGQVADRWAVTAGNTTTCLWTQVDAGTAVETGLLARHYGRITQNTNAAKFILSQFIINAQMAHLRGQPVRISVKLKQFVGSNANYRLGLLQLNSSGTIDVCPAFSSAIGGASVEPTWGTNIVAINPDAAQTPENGTISGVALTVASTAGWVRSSATFTVPANCVNLIAVLYRDTIGAASDSVGIAEFQLTQGTNIIDYVEPEFDLVLLRCQRFFSKSFPQTVVPAAALSEATAGSGATGVIGKAAATALAVQISVQFPETMWKVPTLTYFTPTAAGAAPFRLSGTTPAIQTATATRTSSLTDRGAVCTATGDVNGAVGDLVGVHYTADAEFVT